MGTPDRPVPPHKDVPLEARIRTNDVIAGRYRIEGIIGSGGMGLVVSAKHVTMGSRVAIKLLRLEEESDPKGAVSRFVREARAIARIQSDHVVRVLDVAALPDGTPYMVMEYLEGRDLKQVIAERDQLPIGEAIGYVLQACEGLAEAHAAGVIHRDLKPSNIFLARKPSGQAWVKVLDFGIAKLLPRVGEVAMTTTASLMGSPLYMAPEQMRSSRDIDQRADVWSLALILYELLAGESAFGGETIPEVCMNVMSAEPAPLSAYRGDIPPELDAVVAKALSKDREARHGSMGELARALERFASSGLHVHAARASAAVRSVRDARVEVLEPRLDSVLPVAMSPDVPPASEAPVLAPTESTLAPASAARAAPLRRRRTPWIALAVAACAVGVGVGALATRRPVDSPAAAPTAVNALAAPPLVSASPAPSAQPPTVPVESLPLAKDLPRAAPSISAHPKPSVAAPPRPPPAASSSTPSPAPATPASAKDGWQWGDRN